MPKTDRFPAPTFDAPGTNHDGPTLPIAAGHASRVALRRADGAFYWRQSCPGQVWAEFDPFEAMVWVDMDAAREWIKHQRGEFLAKLVALGYELVELRVTAHPAPRMEVTP